MAETQFDQRLVGRQMAVWRRAGEIADDQCEQPVEQGLAYPGNRSSHALSSLTMARSDPRLDPRLDFYCATVLPPAPAANRRARRQARPPRRGRPRRYARISPAGWRANAAHA